jgi:hypothetical protein
MLDYVRDQLELARSRRAGAAAVQMVQTACGHIGDCTHTKPRDGTVLRFNHSYLGIDSVVKALAARARQVLMSFSQT